MSWTEDQLAAYMAKRQADLRRGRGHTPAVDDVPDPGLESSLQDRCLKYCEERGWPVWHDWSKKRNTPGWPDLFVFKPEGELVLIELKAGTRQLRKEQDELRRQLMFLGHVVHIVRSRKRFIEVLEGGDRDGKCRYKHGSA